jgi:hypothetical protein
MGVNMSNEATDFNSITLQQDFISYRGPINPLNRN